MNAIGAPLLQSNILYGELWHQKEKYFVSYTWKLNLLKSWKQQKCPCLFQLPDDCVKLWIAYNLILTREKVIEHWL